MMDFMNHEFKLMKDTMGFMSKTMEKKMHLLRKDLDAPSLLKQLKEKVNKEDVMPIVNKLEL
jgi:hypothetical protein